FFQAEDGIRDRNVTGVQTCALPILFVAGEWGFELGRLDAGALYDKYVGESERRLDKALELAQKLAPLVLWIDEIEKAFASASSRSEERRVGKEWSTGRAPGAEEERR